MTDVLAYWASHREELFALVAQHVVLVAAATGIAIAIGVPAGIVAVRRPRLGAPVVALANIVQTIPSLAMFGFLIPVPFIGGVGAQAALVVLILYGLLPIIRTTAAGLTAVDPAVVEAGVSLGLTPRQLLRHIELPLALPSIVAGIRVAAVVGVGTATIAAAIGAGGLGEYIFRGLSMVDSTVILAGAIPAAVLALTADLLLTTVERRLRRASAGGRPARIATAAAVVFVLLVSGAALVADRRADVRVGSKNFTEQLILGELMAQAIERYTTLTVDRRLNLGGTFIADRALLAGEIDLYVEYTGTALTAIFGHSVADDRTDVLARVREAYAATGRTLLEPLGFNNTFAVLVRGETARRLGLRTISDAVPHATGWRAGFGYEFLERSDGFSGLAAAYGLRFASPPSVMDLALIYRALHDRRVDLIAGDATNGLIEALDLTMLVDDRAYFPPYHAVPVVRAAALRRLPEVGAALARLEGRISEADMRTMNHAVDGLHRDIAVVAAEFLDGLEEDR